jgi:hypothetical protein
MGDMPIFRGIYEVAEHVIKGNCVNAFDTVTRERVNCLTG